VVATNERRLGCWHGDTDELQTAEETGDMEKEEVAALIEDAIYEDANDLMFHARPKYNQKLAG